MSTETILPFFRFGYRKPPENHLYGGFKRLSAAPNAKLIDPSDWEDIDLGIDAIPVKFQEQSGCVGQGSHVGFWLAAIAAGITIPPDGFSPTSLYAMVNHGVDKGAIVSEAMQACIDYGFATGDQVPESEYFEWQLSDEAKETRKRYRVADAYHCSFFEAIGSALQLRYPVVFGLSLPYGYQSVGANGVMPIAPPDPLAGHCMCAYGTTKNPRNGRPLIKARTSWGSGYGNRGNIVFDASHFQRYCDAFAIRADAVDPLDPNQPPVAKAVA